MMHVEEKEQGSNLPSLQISLNSFRVCYWQAQYNMTCEVLHNCIYYDFIQVIHLSSTKFFFLCFLLFFGLDLAFISTTGDGKLLYLGFTGTSLTVDNAATITSNGLLELTNGSVNCKGHAFHPIPLHFRKSHDDTVQSFSVAFVFAIRSSYPIMSLHGMAFIVAPNTNFSDAVASQYLGFMNS
jgi:hypothetical protein